MKPVIRNSLLALGALAVTVPVLYVIAVNAALRAHYDEDRIVLGGKQVELAINDYVEKHGSPPERLETLIPEFMSSMPSFPAMSNVQYCVSADAHGWTLDIYRPKNKHPLVYRRTNTGLSVEDTKRRIDTENGCYVLETR
jgi:hypothetical protein